MLTVGDEGEFVNPDGASLVLIPDFGLRLPRVRTAALSRAAINITSNLLAIALV